MSKSQYDCSNNAMGLIKDRNLCDHATDQSLGATDRFIQPVLDLLYHLVFVVQVTRVLSYALAVCRYDSKRPVYSPCIIRYGGLPLWTIPHSQ